MIQPAERAASAGAGVTTGQIQIAHFNLGSSLNAVFGYRTLDETSSCCLGSLFP